MLYPRSHIPWGRDMNKPFRNYNGFNYLNNLHQELVLDEMSGLLFIRGQYMEKLCLYTVIIHWNYGNFNWLGMQIESSMSLRK